VRVFNASKTATEAKIKVHFSANKAKLMNLDGTEAANLPLLALNSSAKEVSLKMNPFGITTLKFANNEH
jgi:hypothetical protein